jgi:hypothetical protein
MKLRDRVERLTAKMDEMLHHGSQQAAWDAGLQAFEAELNDIEAQLQEMERRGTAASWELLWEVTREVRARASDLRHPPAR